jgi:hypothetical protein
MTMIQLTVTIQIKGLAPCTLSEDRIANLTTRLIRRIKNFMSKEKLENK